MCSAACGVIFEGFCAAKPRPPRAFPSPLIGLGAGDQCGNMLTDSGMGGMDEMGIFYDHCLESLYPPGACVSQAHDICPACRPLLKDPGGSDIVCR